MHEQLKKIDADYGDVEGYLGVNPIRTTVICGGTFSRYAEARIREGAALSHLKPAHVNPLPEMVKVLIQGSVVDEEKLQQ